MKEDYVAAIVKRRVAWHGIMALARSPSFTYGEETDRVHVDLTRSKLGS